MRSIVEKTLRVRSDLTRGIRRFGEAFAPCELGDPPPCGARPGVVSRIRRKGSSPGIFENLIGETPLDQSHPRSRDTAVDSSERMFGGASALTDQARIGLETGVHSFERILMLMATDKATLCGGTSRLE